MIALRFDNRGDRRTHSLDPDVFRQLDHDFIVAQNLDHSADQPAPGHNLVAARKLVDHFNVLANALLLRAQKKEVKNEKYENQREKRRQKITANRRRSGRIGNLLRKCRFYKHQDTPYIKNLVLSYKPTRSRGLDPNNMKVLKKILLTIVLLLVVAGGAYLSLPKVIENKLGDLGFTQASVGSVNWSGGLSARISNLKLDSQSNVERISVAWKDQKIYLTVSKASIVLDKALLERLSGNPGSDEKTSGMPAVTGDFTEISLTLPDAGVQIELPSTHLSFETVDKLMASGEFVAKFPGGSGNGKFEVKTPDSGGYAGSLEIAQADIETAQITGKNISGKADAQYTAGSPLAASAEFSADAVDAFSVPFRNVTLNYKSENRQHKIALYGATPDSNATLDLNIAAEEKENAKISFSGKLDAAAKDLEKLKKMVGNQKLDIAGSGQAKLSFSGVGDIPDKSLETLSISTAAPVNFKGRLSGNAVDIKNLSLSLDHTPGQIKAHAEASTLALPALSDYLAPVSFSIDANGNPSGKIGFDGRVSDPNGSFVVGIKGQHDVTAETGSAAIKLENVKFTPNLYQPQNMSPVLKKFTRDISGQVGADGKISWKKTKDAYVIDGSGSILAENISGFINDMEVAGIHGVIAFNGLAPPTTQPDQILYIGALNAGVPLSDGLIKFTLGPEKNRLHISDLRWNFAGGVLSADPFAISLDNPDTEVVLKAQTLDLKQIFDMAALEGLDATGLVQGSLPLVLKEGKISVHGGWLAAQDKGTIQYAPENPPAFLAQTGNAGLDTLKGALQNFHFNELSLKIDGDAGGQQKVTLQAKGNNPDFQGGFPVNINLNLEGALDSVLRQNLNNFKMPEVVRKQIESYEEKHAQ